jgi:transcriptional regulator with XRE-family HTH domain
MNPRKNRTRPIELGVVSFVDHSIAIAKAIDAILKKQNKTQSDLAILLNKKESEISKWLQGSHNFTLKTISKIEEALNAHILSISSQPEEQELITLSEFVINMMNAPIIDISKKIVTIKKGKFYDNSPSVHSNASEVECLN